jgi:hypothetical protein
MSRLMSIWPFAGRLLPASKSEVDPLVTAALVRASVSERHSGRADRPERNPGTRPVGLAGQSCLQTPHSMQIVGPRELPGGALKVEDLA